MRLDPNKTYLVWNGTEFPNSTSATFKAPAGSTIDWGDGTVETFDTASTAVNTHTYADGKTEHTIAISGLTSIGDSAFYNCNSLTSVTIGNNVTSISSSAFYNCNSLTSVTIPNGVTRIGYKAFYNCSSLTSVTIPDSVTSIGRFAFYDCSSLTQLILFPSIPPALGSSAIPSTISKIYVPKSSKIAYQAATNWTAFASKIVWDNIYLSFVRFNRKNKEYTDKKLTAPTIPTADSAVTMLADGTVGTKPLSEIGGGGGKLYLHNITLVYNDKYIYFYIYLSTNTLFEIENLQNYFHSPIFATLVNEMGQEYAGVLYCSVSFFGFTGTITDDSGELPSSWSIYNLGIPYSQCVVEDTVVEL